MAGTVGVEVREGCALERDLQGHPKGHPGREEPGVPGRGRESSGFGPGRTNRGSQSWACWAGLSGSRCWGEGPRGVAGAAGPLEAVEGPRPLPVGQEGRGPKSLAS